MNKREEYRVEGTGGGKRGGAAGKGEWGKERGEGRGAARRVRVGCFFLYFFF